MKSILDRLIITNPTLDEQDEVSALFHCWLNGRTLNEFHGHNQANGLAYDYLGAESGELLYEAKCPIYNPIYLTDLLLPNIPVGSFYKTADGLIFSEKYGMVFYKLTYLMMYDIILEVNKINIKYRAD